jgi:uncharacterized protein with NRDE domain
MCTVSYLPTKNGFVLTSSRDEAVARPTLPPAEYTHKNQQLVFPKDEIAGGTWVAASREKRIACLLNGAFEKHKRSLPYSRSRGQVLLESFDYQRITSFCESTNLENVEPFTLVLIDYNQTFELVEFRWDGTQKHQKAIRFAESMIWSSATLYDTSAREMRSTWFQNWLQKPSENTPAHILGFHTSKHGTDEKTDVLMQRTGGLQTVSVSQIVVENDKTTFLYNDWITKAVVEILI